MEKFALRATQWLGTPISLIIHTIFFAFMLSWCVIDPKHRETLLLVFTLIVSLEAIYQMIFLQMTANIQAIQLTQVKSTMEEVQESVDSVQESVEEVKEEITEE